jgi:hypothetical protein
MTSRPSLPALLAAAEEVRASGAAHDPWLSPLQLVGIGWATVELERAADELLGAFTAAGAPEPDWQPAPREALLGASAWVTLAAGARPAIVLLEPDTEGRLSATLARFGEGVAAVYLQRTADQAIDPARLGRSSPGPLGTSRMVLAGPTWGPHVIVIEHALPNVPR